MKGLRAPTAVIAAGTFVQGSVHHYPEEAPEREAHVDGFVIDVHPVTNAQFLDFVQSTGHRTTAEKSGAAVFVPTDGPVDLARPSNWWRHDDDASWRRPLGRNTLTAELADHPVVNITIADANAFARWVGGRLPSESEWEWAAGAGHPLMSSWPLGEDGRLLANVWIGEFPWRSFRTRTPGTTPVGTYAPNPNGLFDMLGNVWELTADRWSTSRLPPRTEATTCCGPTAADLGCEPDRGMVAKGGSYLCAANYCARYRPAARHRQMADEAACHIGFRCAYETGTLPHHG